METVKEVLEFIGFFEYIRPIIGAFVVALAVVYVLGRMLDLVHTARAKNAAAFLSAVAWATLSTLSLVPEKIADVLMIVCGTVLLYVLVGFRLYERLNSMQDRHFGEATYLDPDGREIVLRKKRPEKKVVEKKPASKPKK